MFENGGKIFLEKIFLAYKAFQQKTTIILKRIRNRTPDGLKENFARYILPYSGIILVASFVFISNFARASETVEVLTNDQVMDLDPVEVANVVGEINPYTPNYQEDSVQVALAMKDQDFLGKPVVLETTKTEIPQEQGER